MKRIFIIIFISVLNLSCNDVKIVESYDNFECRRSLTCFNSDKNNTTIEQSKYQDKILKKYPISDENNLQYLKGTRTLFLENTSETKVYLITVQKKIGSKVQYEDFSLEPTNSVCLGCSEKFTVSFDLAGTHTQNQKILLGKPTDIYKKTNYNNYEGKINGTKNVIYKIHKTKMVSEY